MFEKILVPLDGSELAERALQPALELAEGEVILLRVPVLKHMMMPDVAGEYGWLWPDQSLAQCRLEATDYLKHIEQQRGRSGLALRGEVLDGDEASVIVATAAEEQVDLIIMSTHGYSGIARRLLGSVTERVLRSTSIPVWVVRTTEPVKRVLITLDGSSLAEQALAPGLAIARRMGADVILLRVVPPVVVSRLAVEHLESTERGLGQRLMESLYEEADNYLATIARRYEDWDLPITTEVVGGPPAASILAFAHRRQVNLIAMTTHGHTGLRRWWYGSVTPKVMRGSNASILVIRSPVEELN